MQTLDSSLAFYSLERAEQALKDSSRWFNHLMDESIAFQRAMLDFEIKPMGVDDAVALWFPVVTATTKGQPKSSHAKRAVRTATPSRRTTKTKASASLETVSPLISKAPEPSPVATKPAEILVNDLKAIAGIGPGLEKKLNAAGITSYVQIAALTSEEITRLERDVVKFAGRITRDDWIGQAKQLLA